MMFGFVRILEYEKGVGTKRAPTLRTLFYRGNYLDVVQLVASGVEPDELPYAIGAFAYSGRRDDGAALFKRLRARLSREGAVVARFFLGIAYVRAGDHAIGRRLLAENVLAARKRPEASDETLFYAHQGLAFARYVAGRYAMASRSAHVALAEATAQRFVFGVALANDLLGHALMQIGRVHEGLARLEATEQAARRTGDGGLADSIKGSREIYCAQFGLRPDAVASLSSAVDALSPQNSHARSALLLELAAQRLLRGQTSCAADDLNAASELVYRSGHRRQGHALSLRWAELQYRSGQTAAALHGARSVRAALDPKRDRPLGLIALGLEAKCLRELGLHDEAERLREPIERWTRFTGRGIGYEQLSRSSSRPLARSPEDRVAATLESASTGGRESARALIEAGYLSRLHETLGISRGAQALALGLLGGDLAVFDRGDVEYVKAGATKLVTGLLREISKGERSRAQLIEALYGYTYEASRHDALIFQLASRLRALLGKRSHWIEASETGYRLAPGVVARAAFVAEVAVPQATEVHARSVPDDGLSLNARQHRLVEYMRKCRFVSTAECAARFSACEMTLRRDFAFLLERNIVRKFGRARATRYGLREPAREQKELS